MRRTKLLRTISLDKLMDLKVDFAFKQLFGIEKNKAITIAFLNAILQRTGRNAIKDIAFKKTEAGGEYEDDKQSRLDLVVVTNADEWINVEIQFTKQFDMVKRSIYYWAGVYREPFEKKMSYKELNPVIAINILNFTLFDQTDRFHTTYHLYEDHEKFRLTDVMEFHFIEMTKLMRDWQADKLDPWNDLLARWLLLLGMVDRRNGKVYEDIFKELEAIAMKDETLREAFKNWEALSMTPEQYFAYEGRMKRIFDEEAAVREAELRVQEGIEKGLQEGLQKGIQEGLQKGILEGQQAEKESMARRLLAKGMEIDDVMEVTELTEEQVRKLKQ